MRVVWRRTGLFSAALSIFIASAAFGQSTEPAPSFEVASVKAVAIAGGEGMGGRGGRQTVTPSPAGITMRNVPLKAVIQWAYHLQGVQVSGPGWLDENRYDVIAKAAGEVPTDRQRLMMQTLLAQRFKLACHSETKDLPAFVFTVAKTGHKLKKSEGEGEMEVKPSGGNRMVASFSKVTLAQIAEFASSPLQGLVVDQTGLKGGYDFTLDMSQLMGGGDFKPTGIEDMITLFIQAAKEQLGIIIEQKKVPAELLIVDHAEKNPRRKLILARENHGEKAD